MLKLRAPAFADSLSKRYGTVLSLSGRRLPTKLSALSGLLLDNSFVAASIDTSKMARSQAQAYVKAHGQILTTTGIRSGNYSFDYADSGGTVPGFVCTLDEAYC
jgi:hypothetical protein